jgi:hypothetical protein
MGPRISSFRESEQRGSERLGYLRLAAGQVGHRIGDGPVSNFIVATGQPSRRFPQGSAAVVYAMAAFALPCLLAYWPYESESRLIPLLGLVPLIFLIPYSRFLLGSATRAQRMWALFLNAVAAMAAYAYLLSWPIWPPPESPFWLILVVAVALPATFLIAATALAVRHRHAFAAGTIAVLLIWPCLAVPALELPWLRSLAYRAAWSGVVLSPLILGVACFLVFSRPRVGYLMGLLGTLVAWPVSILREMYYPDRANSWLMFNLPDYPGPSGTIAYAERSILCITVLIICTVTSCLRSLPSSWTVRRVPIRDRSWPIAAISLLCVAGWFFHAVAPYRVPEVEHHRTPGVTVAHLEKRGLHFCETKVTMLHDSEFYLAHDERRPLHYRSTGVVYRGVAQREDWDRAVALTNPSRLTSASHITRINKWDADVWLVVGERGVAVMFDSAKNPPPPELIQWQEDIEKLPKRESWHGSGNKDICFGFCYDPLWRTP